MRFCRCVGLTNLPSRRGFYRNCSPRLESLTTEVNIAPCRGSVAPAPNAVRRPVSRQASGRTEVPARPTGRQNPPHRGLRGGVQPCLHRMRQDNPESLRLSTSAPRAVNLFARQRAGRPEIALVMTVCSAAAPKRRPISRVGGGLRTADERRTELGGIAPRSRQAAMPAPSMMPPAAITGISIARTSRRVRANVPRQSSGASGSNTPR